MLWIKRDFKKKNGSISEDEIRFEKNRNTIPLKSVAMKVKKHWTVRFSLRSFSLRLPMKNPIRHLESELTPATLNERASWINPRVNPIFVALILLRKSPL